MKAFDLFLPRKFTALCSLTIPISLALLPRALLLSPSHDRKLQHLDRKKRLEPVELQPLEPRPNLPSSSDAVRVRPFDDFLTHHLHDRSSTRSRSIPLHLPSTCFFGRIP
ncbi:hypothetical protein MA16_Dca003897 [Dendrobium catenatum]|uniref:Uncharacterized protein n=1 Tax=Dendrobium catenatum TaxID=906689 RepID=A0A2I0X1V0_9ASPA|nr:hypothetical protein MA16_Dca003897 [Dendrobium catenatum]